MLVGFIDGLDHPVNVRFLPHIGIEGRRFSAPLPDNFAQLLGTIPIGKVIYCNPGASCGQLQRDCGAQPARGTGNQRSSSL